MVLTLSTPSSNPLRLLLLTTFNSINCFSSSFECYMCELFQSITDIYLMHTKENVGFLCGLEFTCSA